MTKKRYSLSLTQETVEEFQKVAKALGMPSVVMSQVCDEAIEKVLGVFKVAQAKGSFSITDMFTMMGEMVEEETQKGTDNAKKLKEKKKE